MHIKWSLTHLRMMGDCIPMLEERSSNSDVKSSVVQQRYGLRWDIPCSRRSWRSRNSSTILPIVVTLVIFCTAGSGFAETQSLNLGAPSSNLLTAGLAKKNFTALYTSSSLKKVDSVNLQPWYFENLLKQHSYKPRPKRTLIEDVINNGKSDLTKRLGKSWPKTKSSISQPSVNNESKKPRSSGLIQSMPNQLNSNEPQTVNFSTLKVDASSKQVSISPETINFNESNPNLPFSDKISANSRLSPLFNFYKQSNTINNSIVVNRKPLHLPRNNLSNFKGLNNNANYALVDSNTVIPSKNPAPPSGPNWLHGRPGQFDPSEGPNSSQEMAFTKPITISQQPTNNTTASQQPTNNTTASQQPTINTIISQQPTIVTTISQQPTINTTILQQPTINTTISQQPTINTTISQQPTINTTISQQPTINTTISQQPTINTTISQQPTINTTISQQPTTKTTTPSISTTNTTTPAISTNTSTHSTSKYPTAAIITSSSTFITTTTEQIPIKYNTFKTKSSTAILVTPNAQPNVAVEPVENTDFGGGPIACVFFICFGMLPLLFGIAKLYLLTKKKDEENVISFSARRFSNIEN